MVKYFTSRLSRRDFEDVFKINQFIFLKVTLTNVGKCGSNAGWKDDPSLQGKTKPNRADWKLEER